MRTRFICGKCAAESAGTQTNVVVELNDALLFDSQCERGHKVLMTLETTKFSLLFDFGISALLDGYYREAVSSVATSVERLYEFFIRVVCEKNGCLPEEVESMWKIIGNHSERQLGAFVSLYLQEARVRPALMAPKTTEFRNRVVHKGYLPTRLETLDYARSAHDHMIGILRFVSDNMQAHSDTVWVAERASRAPGRTDLQTTSHGNANFVSRTRDPLRTETPFDRKLEIFSRGTREQRWIFN